MTCDICGKKKATVHLTEIVDEQMSEMHLCEECARQKSSQMEQQFGLADLLAGLSDTKQDHLPPRKAKKTSLNVPAAACLMRISANSDAWAVANATRLLRNI